MITGREVGTMAELNTLDMKQELKKPGALGIVWTTRRKIILSVLVIGTMLESSCYALMAPFYPEEVSDCPKAAIRHGAREILDVDEAGGVCAEH